MRGSGKEKEGDPIQVRVEVSTCSLPGKAEEILAAFRRELSRLGEKTGKAWNVMGVGCRGLCFKAPSVEVVIPQGKGAIYSSVKPEEVSQIAREHIVNGVPIARRDASSLYHDFLSSQERRVLRHCGVIDPEDIDSYREAGGYRAMERALKEMNPEDVLTEIQESQLRDRDAHAFYTGEKLERYRKRSYPGRYLFCTGEGEAAEACITIALIESNPFALLEGMALVAYALPGVEKGYIFLRSETHPLVYTRLSNAIVSASRHGYLGRGILGTSFSFEVELKMNGEEFHPRGDAVCCSACGRLLTEPVQELKEEQPLYLRDFEARWHLDNAFNAETFATIPLILSYGSSWFKEVGSPDCPGTKIFSLVGDIPHPGLVEVPYGTTLSQIMSLSHNRGGSIKAFMLGGAGGGLLPVGCMEVPLTPGTLERLGSRVGSGKILILDQGQSVVTLTRYALEKRVEENCGRCHPCVKLLESLLNLLRTIEQHRATSDDFLVLKQVAENLKENALCEFGRMAPTLILSGIAHFEEEYRSYLVSS